MDSRNTGEAVGLGWTRKEAVSRVLPVLGLLCLLFAPAMGTLVRVWYHQEDYGHGFFVLPIASYMLWQKRERLGSIPIRPVWAALPILLAGVVLYVASSIARFHTLTYLSMMVVLFGLILFLTGKRMTREVAPQVALLLFMFPIPSALYVQITNPLQLLIAKVSTEIVRAIGIPVLREGNLLYLARMQMEVAEACSGIRSLYSYLMLGCVFAFWGRTRLARVTMILSAVPLALFINVLRVTGTAVLSQFYGSEVAQGYFHATAGFVLFAAGVVLLFVEYRLLHRPSLSGNAEPGGSVLE